MLLSLHIFFVLTSGFSFFVRGIGYLGGQAWINKKIVKVLPHIIDTGLLITAIMLLVTQEISPLTDWVLAKIIALLVYIFLGVMAFRLAKTIQKKAFYWGLALMVFTYMLLVAKTHNPLVFV